MHPLAMSLQVDSTFAIPSELGDNKAQAAKLLSGVLNIPRDLLEAKFESGATFVWIARKLPPEKREAVEALNLKGIYFQKENQRFYPSAILPRTCWGSSTWTKKDWAESSTNSTSRFAARAKRYRDG